MLLALSHAWASWKTAPGVALLSVVAFAVGIGSATAIFTVINGVLLRPLPYPDGDRFVALSGARTTQPGIFMAMSVPELRDYEQAAARVCACRSVVLSAHVAPSTDRVRGPDY